MTKERLPVETFEIPAAEIRRGYRSAIYFNRAKAIAAANPQVDQEGVLMQVFQKGNSILCGMDEAIAVLKVGMGRWQDEAKATLLFDDYMQAKLATRQPNKNKRHTARRILDHIEDELDDLWVSEFDKSIVETASTTGALKAVTGTLHTSAVPPGLLAKPWVPGGVSLRWAPCPTHSSPSMVA
jgi:hypothetical protein